MTAAKTLHDRGTVSSHGEVSTRLAQPGDYVIVHRGVPRSLAMVCPDGCGEVLTVNLDPRSGKAWRLDVRSGRLTLYPSIWREEGCRSHFIIWRDSIKWCDRHDDCWPLPSREVQRSVEKLLASKAGKFLHYEVIADECSINPWDALWAAQALKSKGAVEAKGYDHFAVSQTTLKGRKWRWWRWW